MVKQERERNSGKYKHTIDRVCVCGHTLGSHLAERYRDANGRPVQECIVHEAVDGAAPCDCVCFKPARR